MVIHRQAKVAARLTGTCSEPVPGTSKVTGISAVEMTNVATTKDETGTDEDVVKGAVMAGTRKHGRVGNPQRSKAGLSQAQMNVVRTMIYIAVCFTLCWMPLYLAAMLSSAAVKQFKSIVTVRLSLHLITYLYYHVTTCTA